MRRRALPLLLALAVLAPACSTFGEAPAATVAGTEISVKSIESEIKTIQTNKQYRDVLEQSYGAPTEGAGGKGTFDAAFVAQVLSLRVWYQMIEEDLKHRDVPITDDVMQTATQAVEQQFASLDPDPSDDANPVLDGFPKDYRKQLIHQRALVETIDGEISKEIGTDERQFYDDNKDEFAEICLSHVLVGVQSGRTPEEAQRDAQRLYDRIQKGEDFEDIATNESDDTTAAANAGDLGCGSRLSLQFDPVFEKAAFALKKGVVSKPVQTQFGSHLILVRSRTIPKYDEVADQVQSVMQEAHDARINDYLVKVICGTDVDVNPRYGTWSSSKCDGVAPQLPSVEPPEGPAGSEPEAPAPTGQ
jgi:foldase protein PrsA